jgi:hypothetical protein
MTTSTSRAPLQLVEDYLAHKAAGDSGSMQFMMRLAYAHVLMAQRDSSAALFQSPRALAAQNRRADFEPEADRALAEIGLALGDARM